MMSLLGPTYWPFTRCLAREVGQVVERGQRGRYQCMWVFLGQLDFQIEGVKESLEKRRLQGCLGLEKQG